MSVVDDLSCNFTTTDLVVESDILLEDASEIGFSHSSRGRFARIGPDSTKQGHTEPDCNADAEQDERTSIYRIQ